MHSVILNPYSRYYPNYLLYWYLLFLFLFWGHLYPFIGLLLLSPIMMPLYFWLKDRVSNEKPLRGYRLQLLNSIKPGHAVSESMLHFSLLLLALIALLGKLTPGSDATLFFMLIIVFALTAMTALYFYLFDAAMMKGETGERYNVLFSFIFRCSWLVVFFISYVIAKNAMMEVADITFEASATKLTVISLACIYFILFYFSLVMCGSVFLTFLEKKETVAKSRLDYIITLPALPFMLLIVSSWMIFYVAFNVNLQTLFNYVMTRTVALDTRNTFSCNDRYLTIKALPRARYLTVGENDYRIFAPSKQLYSTWRLKCVSTPPGYRYWPVMDADDVVNAQLRERVNIFNQALEAARRATNKEG